MVGLQQQCAQILPDEGVEGATRDVASGTALALGNAQGIAPSLAHIVGLPTRHHGACGGAQPAVAATDHGAEQVGEVGVVAGAALLVARQLLLDTVKDLLRDDWGHGHANPFLARAIAGADSRPHGQQRRLALGGGHDAGAVAVRGPGVGRILQDPPHTRHIPARLASGGENASAGESEGDAVYGRRRLKIPGEHLADHDGCGRVELQASGITRMLGIEPVAKGRAAPGKQLACP